MEDADKTWGKGFRFIFLAEHPEDDAAYSMEQAFQEGAVPEEIRAQLIRDSEDAVAVGDIYNLKGHGGGMVNGIFITAGRAEPAMAVERDKFKVSAAGAAIHGPPPRKRGHHN